MLRPHGGRNEGGSGEWPGTVQIDANEDGKSHMHNQSRAHVCGGCVWVL